VLGRKVRAQKHHGQATSVLFNSKPNEHVQPRKLREPMVKNDHVRKRKGRAVGEFTLTCEVPDSLVSIGRMRRRPAPTHPFQCELQELQVIRAVLNEQDVSGNLRQAA